ncbi:spermatogenesis-associated protein 20 isoform X2 [Ooceraea biroi]|uniref:spermatogenesis-associated protein 20 isoform X2 n=1 Tax=Ooceraea biroi TaxID=2015173 RepID=UPI000F075225|nr:spermatogenesis-associated protein 20 isoform X2 [Ooceraea biroi]XP_026825501.1 spermatogenesis-associated protein 20 isoform X2 [Ooceraea biroi]XP_026825502.1 spermatogenesis-associated protein 20 isoform X2 [Ooceraea biroi]XP_026825503.1 spermatogenesis-associated protein 20 isoform X2 [Ooceraea biroi]
MTSGRCSILSTVRYVSELSKKRYSTGVYGCRAFHLVDNTPLPIVGRRINKLNYNSTFFLSTSIKMASTSSSTKSSGHSATKKLNRLSLEKSPYLLQHATNPVEWYPWSDEALERARKENKMIFLSVGYSTCHWCHVMEKESFENGEIARIMNENFINIKVDREERPDIDRIYMTFVQAKSGHGGWPMSVFLSPDLTPITGGTYFPPDDKYGLIGFKSLLLEVAKKWTQHKGDIIKSGIHIASRLRDIVECKQGVQKEDGVPTTKCALLCVHLLANGYDPKFGGFSSGSRMSGPKFPEPVNFNFLFNIYARSTSAELRKQCLEMCLHTLKKMAHGGIHDHVGQGFSRYSVDGEWHVPHFEKMLYDQAQLIQAYADAYVVTKDAFYSDIVDDIATYVAGDLRHKEGGFYSAEDADSLPEPEASAKREGAFYVWSYDEIKELLDEEIPGHDNVRFCDLICYHFNVKKEGNVKKAQDPHGELTGKNVFIVYDGVEQTAEHFGISVEDTKSYIKEACRILFEERVKRPRPHLDDKIITAWNGLMISGFARAGAAVRNKRYVELATDAAKFVERYLFDKDKGVLLRSCYRGEGDRIMQTSVPIHGFHDDYAFVVKGLLDLYEANFDPHWIELAEQLQDIQDRLFWDTQNGGYFCTIDDSQMILRMKDAHDGAEPSSNSIACSNLLRLASYLERKELKDKAEQLLCAFGKSLTEMPIMFPQLTLALLDYYDATQIFLVGKSDAEDTVEMLNVVRERLVPGRVLVLADPEERDNILFRKNAIVDKLKPENGQATAVVCQHRTCSLHITNPSELASRLDDCRSPDL